MQTNEATTTTIATQTTSVAADECSSRYESILLLFANDAVAATIRADKTSDARLRRVKQEQPLVALAALECILCASVSDEASISAKYGEATATSFTRATSQELCSIIVVSCQILKHNAFSLARQRYIFQSRQKQNGMNEMSSLNDTAARMKSIPTRLLSTMISQQQSMPSSNVATSMKSLCLLISSNIVAECCAAALTEVEQMGETPDEKQSPPLLLFANNYVDDVLTSLSSIGKEFQLSSSQGVAETIALDSAMEILGLLPLEASNLIRRCSKEEYGSSRFSSVCGSRIMASRFVMSGANHEESDDARDVCFGDIEVDIDLAISCLLMTLGNNVHIRGQVMEIASSSLRSIAILLSELASGEQFTLTDRIVSGIRSLECLHLWMKCDVITTTAPVIGWINISDVFGSDCIQTILMFTRECFRLLLAASSCNNDNIENEANVESLTEALNTANDVCNYLIDLARAVIKATKKHSGDVAQNEAGLTAVALLCEMVVSSHELLMTSPSVSKSGRETHKTQAIAARETCVGFCCNLAIAVLEKHGGILFLDEPPIQDVRSKITISKEQDGTPHFLGRYIAYIALVESIAEGPLELCTIPAMDLLYYAVATVSDSLIQYLTMCYELSQNGLSANSTEFSNKASMQIKEMAETLRSMGPAIVHAICNRYYELRVQLSHDEEMDDDDPDLVSPSSEHNQYFMTSASDVLPGIAANFNVHAGPGCEGGWDLLVARTLISELESFSESNSPLGVATCVRLAVSLVEVMIDSDDEEEDEYEFDYDQKCTLTIPRRSPGKLPSKQHERRYNVDKIWLDILKLSSPFVNYPDVAMEVATFLGELGPCLRYRGCNLGSASPYPHVKDTPGFVPASCLTQPYLIQTNCGIELFKFVYTLIGEVMRQIERCQKTRTCFGRAMKKIALSSAKSFTVTPWRVDDESHPFNILTEIMKITQSFPPTDLVFAAACFAGYCGKDAVVTFCNETVIPIIRSKQLLQPVVEESNLDVLTNTFGGIRVSGTWAGVAVETLLHDLSAALVSTESTQPQIASSQALLSAMVSSACEDIHGDFVENIVCECSSVIKRSIYLCRSSLDKSTSVAKSLATIIESCGRKHEGMIHSSLCSALREEFDIFASAIASCTTFDCVQNYSEFIETVLGSFRAAARTGILLTDHVLFGQIIRGALKVFGTSIWQCEGEQTTKMSLDLFKWCLWSCAPPNYPGLEGSQDRCMNSAFGDPEMLKKILIAFCSGSLGLTCDVFRPNQLNFFTCDIRNAIFAENQNIYYGDLIIRGQLQRSYVNSLYTILYGDESSIPQSLVSVFANTTMVAPAVTAALAPYCSKLIKDDEQMAANVKLAAWVVRGLAEKGGRRGQNMRSFFFVVGKVLSGEEDLERSIGRTRIILG